MTADPSCCVAFDKEDALSVLVTDPLAVPQPLASSALAARLQQSPLAAGGNWHKSHLIRSPFPLSHYLSELFELIIVDGTQCQFLIRIVWVSIDADYLGELGGSLAAVLPVVQEPELREGVRPSLTRGGHLRPLFFRGL
jgi:hypothetical protein